MEMSCAALSGFTSKPLGERCDIIGSPTVKLRLSSDQPIAQIAVRLNHIHPDGASTRMTYGVLNLCHRNGHTVAQPLVPDEEFEISLDLDQMAYRVPAGHCVRVAISTCYWPLLWPSPVPVELTLHAGEINIPIRKSGDQDERIFPTPEADQPWQVETIRPTQNERRQVIDMNSGIVSLEIIDDFGSTKDSDHGLVHGSVAREWWSIHPDDPLSASGRTHWTYENSRDDWSVRTETYANMTSDSEYFHLTAQLEAYENNNLVFEKVVSESIKRHQR